MDDNIWVGEDRLYGKPLTLEDLYIQSKIEDCNEYELYTYQHGKLRPLRLWEPYPELNRLVLHERFIPSNKHKNSSVNRFIQWENNPDSEYFIDTMNTDLSYCAANSKDCKNIVELCNKLYNERITVCNYIQTKYNETKNHKNLYRFINGPGEAVGYIEALYNIKKGLIKRDLWDINIPAHDYTQIEFKKGG